MRTKTINIYKFDELSQEAQLKAIAKHQEYSGYAWGDDAIKSLQALAKHFGGELTSYGVDFFKTSHSHAYFEMPELEDAEIIARVKTLGTYDPITLRGYGDCVLTGYCADEDAIEGFRMAHSKGEKDLDKLMQAAFENWLKAAQADCEGEYSIEGFSEFADANNLEYHEDGSLA